LAAPEAELGILLIHGIGQQKRGETLLAFGEPLCRWLDGAIRGAGRGRRLEIQRTVLGPGSEGPAHAQLRLPEAPDDGWSRRRRVLLAESCWAESFPTPSFGEVARWALVALPWTLASQFARRFQPALGARGALLRHYPRFALETISSVLAFLAGAGLLMAVAALLLLALVPVARLRDFLLRLQMRMAAVIGDSYVLLGSSLGSSAVVSRVRDDLDWLASRCERVALVAHSQGAAVAHRLIESLERERDEADPAERTDGLLDKLSVYFSFGSGLGKLHDIQEAMAGGGRTLWLGFVLMASVLAVAIAVPVLSLTGPRVGLPGFFLFMLMQAGGFAIVLFLGMSKFFDSRDALVLRCFREPPRGGQAAPGGSARIRWVDCFASADPVSSGPLLSKASDGITSQPVRNRAAFWSDHTTYWENPDEFIRTLVEELPPPLGPRWLGRRAVSLGESGARRRWRVAWLTAFRVLYAGALAFCLWSLGDRLLSLGRRVLELAAPLLPAGVSAASPRAALLAGVAAPCLAALVWFRLAFVAWKRWQRRDLGRTLAKRELDEGGLPFLAFIVLGLAFPAVVAALAALGFDADRLLAAGRAGWNARAQVGFGSLLLPLFSALAAFPTWWLAVRADEAGYGSDRGLRGETYLTAWIACAVGALAAVTWLGLRFPEVLQPLPPGASFRQQTMFSLALFGPHLLMAGAVALFSRTAGPALGRWLTARSLRSASPPEDEEAEPWSAEAMGAISCAIAVATLGLRGLLDHFALNAWAPWAIVPLWFVAALAGMNAFERELQEQGSAPSLGSSLGGLGLLLSTWCFVWGLQQ
jgi:hypothetical protein